MSGEFAAIEGLRRLLGTAPQGETWIGDDAAVVRPPPSALLLAADFVIAGVHADLDIVSLEDFGWKALAVNISDIAAMGGRPMYALAAVGAPADTDLGLLYRGISAAAREYSCLVVGGDLTNAETLSVAVTVVGDGSGSPPPVLRSGASAGDCIFVTGPLGASAAGLSLLRRRPFAASDRPALVASYRRPTARVEEGRTARAAGATAMIDVSDGLSADLRHIAESSGVGVVLDDIPVADGATRDEALGGGEDYELAFTAPDADAIDAAFADAGLAAPIRIGVCTDDPAERRLGSGDLPAAGWEHRFA